MELPMPIPHPSLMFHSHRIRGISFVAVATLLFVAASATKPLPAAKIQTGGIRTAKIQDEKIQTKTSFEISVSSAERGVPVTFSVAVKSFAGSAVTPGEVVFCDANAAHCLDDAILGTTRLTGGGTATLRLRPSVGAHHIYALFKGTQTYASSRSCPIAIEIKGKFETTTSLASLATNGTFTMTATTTQKPRGLTKPPLSGHMSLWYLENPNFSRIAPLSKPTYGFEAIHLSESQFSYVVTAILSADFNNDGFPDLAVLGSGGVEVFLGDPAHPGEFLSRQSYAVSNLGSAITAGDFNEDGLLDLAVTSGAGVALLLGDPANPGQFRMGSFTSTSGNNSMISAGDFNGDGLLDIVQPDSPNQHVLILLNDPAHPGQFLPPQAFSAPQGIADIAVADVDGDGVLDVALASGAAVVTVMLGDPENPGKLLSGVSYPVGPTVIRVSLGDFNKDGLPDIAVSNVGLQNIGVLLNDAEHPGQFLPVTLSYAAIDSSYSNYVAVGDFNQDGTLDVAAGSATYLGIIFGDPAHPGQFQPEQVLCCMGDAEGENLTAFARLDLDRDEAPVLFASQDAGFTGIFNDTWHPHGTETATATFQNIAAPDSEFVYFRAHYGGAENYQWSQSAAIDPNAPTISNIQVTDVTTNSAVISWTTNVKTYDYVSYYNWTKQEMRTPWSQSPTTKHSIVLSNLADAQHTITRWFQVHAVVFFPDGTHWTTVSPVQYFDLVF